MKAIPDYFSRILKDNNPAYIQSVRRAIIIIELLALESKELSLTEISKRLNWPKSTVHGIISTLRAYNYVNQSEKTGWYSLGTRLFELGNIVSKNWNIKQFARPIMQWLSQLTDQTIQLGTESQGEVLYLEKIESNQLLRIVSDVGGRLPMHCSGLGKMLLAYKTPAQVKSIINTHGLPTFTKKTITNIDDLEKELKKIKKQGYAVDDNEVMEGLLCIAAPIFSYDGSVKYAISISGISSTLKGARFKFNLKNLLEAADEISKSMGYN